MKILIFTSQFCYGAAERLGADLAVDLNQLGIRADLMSMYTEDLDEARAEADRLRAQGVSKVHYLGLRPRPTFVQVLGAAWRLARLIRREGYDLIETSTLTPGLIASWACLLSGARHVFGIHHTFKISEDTSLRYRLFRASVRFAAKTRFYAVSDFVAQAWSLYSGLPASRTRTVYNSISVPREMMTESQRQTLREELGATPSMKIVLCAARLAAYKRQDLIVEALLPICEKEDLLVLFAGARDDSVDGTDTMLARFHQLLEGHHSASRFRLLGKRKDAPAIMQVSQVLVHAATREPFGLVLAEAMALGLPVVAADAEGVPEVLADTGSVQVKPGDAEALRAGVMIVLNRSPEEAQRVRARGMERAKGFSRSERTRNMVKFFDDVLRGSF